MTTLAGQGLLHNIENGDSAGVLNLLHQLNQGHVILNLDERDEDGQTFLMVACQVGEIEVVRELINCEGVDVNAVDNDNWSALLNAAKEGYIDIVTILLSNGADIDHRDMGGWTALMWACYKGRTEVSIELLDKGANPNVKGEHHMSCLIWSAGRGYAQIVKQLLDHGAKVNNADKYGTTPLIWAARKGHRDIVEMLIESGSDVDSAGMNSWTALIIAAKGGYTEVVQQLLDSHPNVNAVDKDGFSALTWAAKDGYVEIVNLLLQKGAYVNLPDRYGDTILIHAVKGGHLDVVKALTKKYADVDVQGVDNKTALYWTAEKGNVNIAKVLMDSNADTELPNKDGDTALLKSARNRNLDLLRLLLDRGAKITATDKRGDTALHISVRGRSKRVTELLLRNPKENRLLYKPNKNGETPYQIDASHQKSILTQVFGARNLNADDNLEGYELYSSTIADVLSEPALHTPITVGLYAKWGSGKSFLIRGLKKEMKSFTQHSTDPALGFSWIQSILFVLISAIVGVILCLTVHWQVGLGVGLGLLALQFAIFGIMVFGSRKRQCQWLDTTGRYVARKLQFFSLFLQIIFCNEPRKQSNDLRITAVKFLFTDNARMAGVVGEQSMAMMIATLFDSMEEEYGLVVTRLYRVLKPGNAAEHGRFKSICCIPYFVIVLFILICILAGISLLVVFGIHSIQKEEYTIINSILITLTIIVGLAILGNIYTWGRIAVSLAVSPRRRLQRITSRMDSLKLEGFLQALKKEVESLHCMTRCMDSFMGTNTRLVVVVDGLDSCEQEKLLMVLEAVHILFGDQDSPFVTILAVDPHVIIKGIEENLRTGLFRDTLNGHDYLRNIVHLPFFLQCPTMPKMRSYSRTESSQTETSTKSTRQDSVLSGSSSFIAQDKAKKLKGSVALSSFGNSSLLTRAPSHFDLSKTLGKNAYFSDVNPKNMRRLMNIIAVTSRLLRAVGVEFQWHRLAAWINITEQWPYRLSWIILEVEDDDEIDSSMPLKSVYERVTPKMPPSKDFDPLLEIDRNPRKLEIFLHNYVPVLTVGDLRTFLPCTINVDPYLRKLIRELQQNAENINYEYAMNVYGAGNPGNVDMGGTLLWPQRRPHSRIDNSPRCTPSRPPSSMRSSHSGFGLSGMTPVPPMGVMHPMLTAQPNMGYMMGNYYPPGASLTYPTANPRASPRITLPGGLRTQRLSRMAVEDVCQVLEKLDGLNPEKIPLYAKSLRDNNVCGQVLLSCELSDLKPIMNMSFGDWELFRSIVQALRDREASLDMGKSQDGTSPADDLGDLQSPSLKFAQSMPQFDFSVYKPSPHYGFGNTFDNSYSKIHGGMVDQGMMTGRSRHSSGERQRAKEPANGRERTRKQYPMYYVQSGSDLMSQPMRRKDSFLGEVMMESEALRGVVDAAGVNESSSDEEAMVDSHPVSFTIGKVSPIPEEMSSVSSSLKSKGTASFHKTGSSYRDDSEDSGSEEMVLISEKAKQKLGGSAVQTNQNHSNFDSSNKSLDRVPSEKKSGRDIATDSEVFSNNVQRSSDLIDTVPLLQPSRSKEALKLVMNHTSKEQLHYGDDESGTGTEVTQLAESLLSPTLSMISSQEHLALRKLAHSDENSAPSAFKLVTPVSSRASSRASSSVSNLHGSYRLASEEEDLRLSISEETDTVVTPGNMSHSSSFICSVQGSPEPRPRVDSDVSGPSFKHGTDVVVNMKGQTVPATKSTDILL